MELFQILTHLTCNDPKFMMPKSVSLWDCCKFIYKNELISTFQNIIFREKNSLKIHKIFGHLDF